MLLFFACINYQCMRTVIFLVVWVLFIADCQAQWTRQRSGYLNLATNFTALTLCLEGDMRLGPEAFEGWGLHTKLGLLLANTTVYSDTFGASAYLSPYLALGVNYIVMPEKHGFEAGFSVGMARIGTLPDNEQLTEYSFLRQGFNVVYVPYFGYRYQPIHYGTTIKIGWQPMLSRRSTNWDALFGLSVSLGFMLE